MSERPDRTRARDRAADRGPRQRRARRPGRAARHGQEHAAACRGGRPGRPFLFVEGNAELTPARLVGHFDPARVLADGYTEEIFVDGPLVAALRSGGLLYVEELNRVPEETLNVLITVMSEGELHVPRLGKVAASSGFRMVAAMNPFDAVGTARISAAVYDRTCRIAMGYQSAPTTRCRSSSGRAPTCRTSGASRSSSSPGARASTTTSGSVRRCAARSTWPASPARSRGARARRHRLARRPRRGAGRAVGTGPAGRVVLPTARGGRARAVRGGVRRRTAGRTTPTRAIRATAVMPRGNSGPPGAGRRALDRANRGAHRRPHRSGPPARRSSTTSRRRSAGSTSEPSSARCARIPSAALEMLADLTVATDERLRARRGGWPARSCSTARESGRAACARHRAAARRARRSRRRPRHRPLDSTRSPTARAARRTPGLDELVARDWGRPTSRCACSSTRPGR